MSKAVNFWRCGVSAVALTAFFSGCGGGGGGTDSPPPVQPPAPITYAIQVTNSPSAASARVGQAAEATIEWRYTSSAANPVSTSYSVSTTTDGLVISAASGSSLPDTTISTALRYECTEIGTLEGALTIAVGNATSNVAWSINCSGQRISAEPIEGSVASVGFDAASVLLWQYETIGETAEALDFTISSSEDSLQIESPQGSANPDTAISVAIAYSCSETGIAEIPLTINVGSAMQSTTWQVECTTETIEVEVSPEPVEASVGEVASAAFGWRYQSTSSIVRELPYHLQSENELLSITNPEGQANADLAIEHTLSFQCTVAGTQEITFAITVGSASQEVLWLVSCSVETIEILSAPLVSAVSVGESSVSELVWRITTSRVDEPEFEYRVVADGRRVVVTGDTGIASADTDISTRFSYVCTSEGNQVFSISIHVGTSTAMTTWALECSRETIVVEQQLEPASASISSSVVRSLIWNVESSAQEPREFTYAIESSSELVRIDTAEGNVVPGERVETRISLDCSEAVRLNVSFAIELGSDRESLVWRVECTEEEILIEESPMPLTVSVGQTAMAELKWRVLTSAVQTRTFAYEIAADSDQVQIDTPVAQVEPVSLVTNQVAFLCNDAGIFEHTFTLAVGYAESQVTWTVECSVETVEIRTSPALVSVSIGQTASATVVWRVESTSANYEMLDYQVSSDLEGLTIHPAFGTASIAQDVATTLEFVCDRRRPMPASFSITIGSALRTVNWEMECTEEAILLVDNPVPTTVVQVGETARNRLKWSFTSTATVPRDFNYSVSSNLARLDISNTDGSVSNGQTLEHELAFNCRRERSEEATLLIKVGEIETQTKWLVLCSRDSIRLLAQPLPQAIPVGESATAVLSWQFQSNIANRSVNYFVETSTRGIQIVNGEGTVTSGNTVETRLRYACSSRLEVTSELTIHAGGATRSTTWQIACLGEDLAAFSANFYQGPLIATVDFQHSDAGWAHEVVSAIHAGGTAPLQFRTNRQLFVEISTKHNENEPLPIRLRMNVDGSSHIAELVQEVETKVLETGSKFRYGSIYLFDVPSDRFSSLGTLNIQVDPNERYPEFDESNNRVQFAFENQNTARMPELEIVFVPIRSRHGVPDLADLDYFTEPTFEYLPVSEISASRGLELDLRNYTWDTSNGRMFIDELYDHYLQHASRGQMYQGVAIPPSVDGPKLCGIAYVNGNVSITSAPNTNCSADIGAHELGHNLSLEHAPACGAEDANADLDYPYPEGNIGTEKGWLMKRREFIDGSAPPEFVQLDYRYYDLMSYCPDVFTSQYSYGKAFTSLMNRSLVVASLPQAATVTPGFEPIEGKSVVVRGTISQNDQWEIQKVTLTDREPLGFLNASSTYTIKLIDSVGGTLLYQEPLAIHEIADIKTHSRSWGVRIPWFDVANIQLVVMNRQNKVVFEKVLELEPSKAIE